MSNTKGSGWLNCREYIVKTIGEDKLHKVIQSLSPHDQAVFAKPILPISWVDYGATINFMIAADKMFGKGDYKLMQDANAYAAQKDVNGIYKILFRVLTPEFVMSNTMTLWRQYYDAGKLQIIKKEHHHITVELTDIPDIPLYHEYENSSFFEEVLKLCKCKNVRSTHLQCIARGDQSCLWEIYWA